MFEQLIGKKILGKVVKHDWCKRLCGLQLEDCVIIANHPRTGSNKDKLEFLIEGKDYYSFLFKEEECVGETITKITEDTVYTENYMLIFKLDYLFDQRAASRLKVVKL